MVLVEPQPSWVRVLACFKIRAHHCFDWLAPWARWAGSGWLWPPLATAARCCAAGRWPWPTAPLLSEQVARWPPLLLPRVVMLGRCCAALSHVLAPCLYCLCHAMCALLPSQWPAPPSFRLPRCTPRVSHYPSRCGWWPRVTVVIGCSSASPVSASRRRWDRSAPAASTSSALRQSFPCPINSEHVFALSSPPWASPYLAQPARVPLRDMTTAWTPHSPPIRLDQCYIVQFLALTSSIGG
jgi:hypothetical protein